MLQPVLRWGAPFLFAKYLGEIIGVGETDIVSDMRDRRLGLTQHALTLAQADRADELYGGEAGGSLQFAVELRMAKTGLAAKLAHGEVTVVQMHFDNRYDLFHLILDVVVIIGVAQNRFGSLKVGNLGIEEKDFSCIQLDYSCKNRE